MNHFIKDETGAVTVDWVVLTAALVGLGLAVMTVVSSGVSNQSDAIDSQLSDGTIIKTGFTGNIIAALGGACSEGDCSGHTYSADQLSGLNYDDINAEQAALAANPLTGAGDSLNAFNDNNGTAFAANGNQAGTFGTDADGNETFTADAGATAALRNGLANEAYTAAVNAEANSRSRGTRADPDADS